MPKNGKDLLVEALQLTGTASDLKALERQTTTAARKAKEELDEAMWELRWQILHLNPAVVEDQALMFQIMLDGGLEKGPCYERIAEMMESLANHPDQLVMVANGQDVGLSSHGPYLTHPHGSVLTFDPPNYGGEGDERWMARRGVVQNLRFAVRKQVDYVSLGGEYFLRGGNMRLIFEKELQSLLREDKLSIHTAKAVWVQSMVLGRPLKAGPKLAAAIQAEREKLVADLIQAFKKASDTLDGIKSKQEWSHKNVELAKEKVTAIPGGIEVRFHGDCARLEESRRTLTKILATAHDLRMDTESPNALLQQAEGYLKRIALVIGD